MNGHSKKGELYNFFARKEGMVIRLLPLNPTHPILADYADKIAIVLKVAYKVPKNIDFRSKFFLGDFGSVCVAIQILVEGKVLWGEISRRTFEVL